MNKPIFDFYSKYYDLLYSDKDYISETNYIVNLMARFKLRGDDILEFGSGTGIHGCLLAGKGYKVTGIERSEQMVNMARLVPGFTCLQGDICTVKLGRTFDAVLSLFHVVSYQTTNSAVQDVFARAADHLKPGGLFLFDVWYSPAVYAKRPEVRIKRISNETVEITRIAEPVMKSEQNRVDVNYTIFVRNIEKDEFEIFLTANIKYEIPKIFIESYKDLIICLKKINCKKIKYLSGYDFWREDIIKVWIAENRSKNLKLITMDHGGLFPLKKSFFYDYPLIISDYYLSTNKRNNIGLNKTNIQIPRIVKKNFYMPSLKKINTIFYYLG
jgi:SAM-dependent methyltransferase